MKQNIMLDKSKSIFRNWLDKNIHRFTHKPVQNQDGSFYFYGITKAITLIFDFRQPEAMLSFNDIDTNQNYDYYAIQYIGNLQYHPLKGFYDADRTDSNFRYYNSYENLLIAEVFEPIIEYCNKNFIKNNALYLIDYQDYTEGFIGSCDETDIDKLKSKTNTNIKYLKYKLLSI